MPNINEMKCRKENHGTIREKKQNKTKIQEIQKQAQTARVKEERNGRYHSLITHTKRKTA